MLTYNVMHSFLSVVHSQLWAGLSMIELGLIQGGGLNGYKLKIFFKNKNAFSMIMVEKYENYRSVLKKKC